MSKEALLDQLSDALSSFSVHKRMLPELIPLVQKTSYRSKLFATFISRLDFLQKHGRLAHTLHKEFEQLNSEIYSMHVVVPDLNLRILYSFLRNGEILLCAFEERQGKRRTDYSGQIPLAQRRKQEMEE